MAAKGFAAAWCAAVWCARSGTAFVSSSSSSRSARCWKRSFAAVVSEQRDAVVPLEVSSSVKLCFVGGKGGVGKTSVSGAIATRLASASPSERILVVSTDPAHSLFDALGVEGSGAVSVMECPGQLFAMEIDANAALEKWKAAVEGFDVARFGERYGRVGAEALKSLGIEEFVSLVREPPPGVDELVALSEVVKLSQSYDRIIVDTAPTGHALRLLDLPTFADDFVTRVTSLKSKLSALASLAGRQVADDVETASNKLEQLRDSLAAVRDALRDPERTEFVGVTIPTRLAAAETERLARGLRSRGVSMRSLIVNRVVDRFDEESARRYAAGQRDTLNRALPGLRGMRVTEVPYVDQELVGRFALEYFGRLAFPTLDDPKRLTICGGKGGVGKTTTSAALAARLASEPGKRVAVVSTDPAHSLGDALDTSLPPGKVVAITESLDALEVDGEAAAGKASEFLRASALRSAAPQLAELADALETPPPGVDELVSLLEVLDLLRTQRYDHVVVDTAPTGHALRMLALPELLDDFAERAADARDRLARNPIVKAALASLTNVEIDADLGADALRNLQDRALALDALLHDPRQCEFIVVAAPTDLSMAETTRLKRRLDESGVAAEKLVVNGVLDDAQLDRFAENAKRNQADALATYDRLAAALGLRLTLVPHFDSDLTGIYGLMALAHALFTPKPPSS